ncbi:Protein NLRC5 [Lamellibrachia satsuma]|nr:Protein NLRC5 [Lamellibrachia satsuma]
MSGAQLTSDEEHFWRLVRIVLEDVPDKLRGLFRKKFQERFHVTWGENQTSGEFFIANSNTSRTGQHIIDTVRQGDTALFDSTALFTCLLFSGTGILLPKPRRGVRTQPIQDSERVDELREMRNELAHATSASLPHSTFVQKLASLNAIYAQLQWNPTVMRQWARDPVVTAECVRLQQDLDAERQRYRALDLTVQALDVTVQGLDGTVHGLDGTVQALDGKVQALDRRVLVFDGTVQALDRTVQVLDGTVQALDGTVQVIDGILQNQAGNVQDLDSRLTSAEGNVQGLGSRLTGTVGQVAGLDSRLTGTEGNVQGLDSRLTGAEGGILRYAQDVQSLKQSMHNLHAQVQRQVEDCVVRKAQVKDELKKLEESLKVVQQHRIEDYLLSKKRTEKENYSVKDLDELYVDLRIHNKTDNYKRVEIRTHHDLLELQKDVASCRQIEAKDLFLPELKGASNPRRVLVFGDAGIGKTMLTMHILDKWVNCQLTSKFRYVFYFALRDVSSINESSLTKLFFEHHDREVLKPSDEATDEFFHRISANPGECLLIFDGIDEYGSIEWSDNQFEHKQVVVMHKLLSSIIQGNTLGQATVLVTSRPGGIKDGKFFDSTAEIYGLTQDKIFEYTSKFSRGDNNLNTRIDGFIRANTNIASLCYIPVQCDLVCRIVRAKERSHSVEELPTTITQLYIMAVQNLAIEHHPLLKGKEVENDVNVVGKLREPLLKHAKLARDGMGQSPIKVTFSKTDIDALDLEKAATECGLLTFSREKGPVLRTYSSTYNFNHLTIQEFLGAVALVSSPQEVASLVMTSANDGQLDLLLMFLCGLAGDCMSKEFLDSLGCPLQVTTERVLELVVQREREKTGRNHKQSVLLLLLLIFESRHPELWSTVKDYVLEDGETLDLSNTHISPVELEAVMFIFQKSNITSLMLERCHIRAAGMEKLAVEIQHLTALKHLVLGFNIMDDAAATALCRSLSLLKQLETLRLWGCHIDDDMAVDIAEATVNSPRLQHLWLFGNHISRYGRQGVKAIYRWRLRRVHMNGQEPPSENCGCELFHQQHNDQSISHSEDSSDNHCTCAIS